METLESLQEQVQQLEQESSAAARMFLEMNETIEYLRQLVNRLDAEIAYLNKVIGADEEVDVLMPGETRITIEPVVIGAPETAKEIRETTGCMCGSNEHCIHCKDKTNPAERYWTYYVDDDCNNRGLSYNGPVGP